MTDDAKTRNLTNPVKMWSEANERDSKRPSENRTMVSWSDTDLHQDRPVSHGHLASDVLSPRAGRCWEDEGSGKEGVGERVEASGLDKHVGKIKKSVFFVDNESGMSSGSDFGVARNNYWPGKSPVPGSRKVDCRDNRNSRGGAGMLMEASGTKQRGGIVAMNRNGKAGKASRCGSADVAGNSFQMSRMPTDSVGHETTDCSESSGESGSGRLAEDVYWIRISEDAGRNKSGDNTTFGSATTTGRITTHIIPLRPQATCEENRRHNDVTATKREVVATTTDEHQTTSMTSSPDVINVSRHDFIASKEPGFSSAEQRLTTSRDCADDVTRTELSSAPCDATKASSMTSAARDDVNRELILSAAKQIKKAETDVFSTYTSVFKVPVVDDGSTSGGSYLLSGSFRGSLVGHTDAVTHCQVLVGHILTSSIDATIRVWDRGLLTQVDVLHCDSAVHCFLCLTTDHQSNHDVVTVLAGTERGYLIIWRLDLGHHGSTVSSKRINRMALHVPNPVLVLTGSADFKRLATGSCFMMFDVASKLSIRRSARGTVKLWRTSEVLDGAFDVELGPVCAKTVRELVTRALPSKKEHRRGLLGQRSLGVRGLAFTPDGSRVAVGLGHPAGYPLSFEPGVVVLCCAETLGVLWTMRENGFSVLGLRFSGRGTGRRRSPWQLLVSTERSIGRVAIYHRHQRYSNDDEEDLYEHHVEWQKNFDDVHSGLSLTSNERFVGSALGEEGVLWDFETGRRVTSLKRPPEGQGPSSDIGVKVLRTEVSDDMEDIACCLSDASVCVFRTSRVTH